MPGSKDFPATAVAIIGMAGRFPDATDLHSFWRNIADGVESLTILTDAELLAAGVPPEQIADPNYVKKCTYLEGADQFDASFFGFNAREAEILDPQHRIFLECAWGAIEDAGYVCDRYPGSVSVFAGTSINTYLLANLLANPAVLEAVGGYQVMVANDKDFLATRVSYKLNLHGPSLTVQTACSTSLVAVQMAWQSLLDHQCDLALAGGVSISFPQKAGYLYREGMIFSPDGHCRPFDEKGAGIRGGSGAGVIVLKRLKDALADGDPIRAVILGAAINNDGAAKMGYTAPSLDGQAEVIAMAQARADVDPGTITYIEAHGTATPLGDPIEIGALSQVFRAGTSRRSFCALGSLKSNLGHLDAAAGVAGLIKTVLSLEHQTLPPTLNFQRPNPQIDFKDSPFYVSQTLAEWKTDGYPRRAGVSSFGIGGTNAHVVLEEAPERQDSVVKRPAQLLLLSARSATALDAAADNLARHLTEHPDVALADVAYTLQVGRKRFEHRRTVICRDRAEAVAALTRRDSAKSVSGAETSRSSAVAFLFSGQGSQYAGMGRELYEAEPTFREELDRCADSLAEYLGRDIRELILTPVADGVESELNQTRFAQPALFAFEYALARTWMSWGVRPSAMLGHSIGEYVAACLAGVLSLEDALRLVAERGRLMQEMPAGRMVAIPLSQAEVTPLLNSQLALAAVNAPRLCVVAGPVDVVSTLERQLAAQGVECRGLHTSHAFHSAMMDPALPPFLDALQGLALGAPNIPYISNLTGTWASSTETTQADYWARHLRNTVRFSDGLQELAKTPGLTLLEVGPGKTLATLARQTVGASGHEVLNSLPHPLDDQSDFSVMLHTLGRLWIAGAEIDWDQVHSGERLQRVSLPTYPFERQRYLVEPQRGAVPVSATLHKKVDIDDWFYVPSWKRVPSLTDTGKTLPPSDGGMWLIFLDDCGVGDRIVGLLNGAGHKYVTIRQGTEYLAEGDQYTIRPGQREDYGRVISEALAPGVQLRHIVHLWSVTAAERAPTLDLLTEDAFDSSFFSLIYLVQALEEITLPGALALTVVSSGLQRVLGEEPLSPLKALLLGPCKVIPHEIPTIRCQSVDIDLTKATDALLEQLIVDAALGTESGTFAYRAGHRWTETCEPMPISRREDLPSRLRKRGVYLITGGLGGLGLVVAKFLAETAQAKLVLTGRSSLPSRLDWPQWLASHSDDDATSQRIRSVRELEALGAEVLMVQADVTDHDAMERAVVQARQEFGTVHGVFHAAGLGGGSTMHLQTRGAALNVLAPKVAGTLILDSLFRGEDLDFTVLFSSVNVLFGFAGSTDYTAANFFLDSYATARNTAGKTVLSIDWDAWQEVGMAAAAAAAAIATADAPGRAELIATTLRGTIESTEGIEALRRVLDISVPRVAILKRSIPELIAISKLMDSMINAHTSHLVDSVSNGKLSQHARPDLAQAFVEPRNERERFIAILWQELLGLDRIGIDDDFFDLGGHSLIATGLLTRIQKEYQVKLPLRAIFEAPTVRQLAERLSELTWAMEAVPASVEGESREEFEI